MNIEKTNQAISDTNNLVPRVIKRGTATVSLTNTSGSVYYGTTSVTVPDILFSAHNVVEVYRIFETDNYAEKLNVNFPAVTSFSNSASVWFNIDSTTSNGNTVLRINIFAQTINITANESFVYVVYSTSYN